MAPPQDGATQETQMKYNKLGNTGLEVSELALGCEGFVKGDEAAQALLSKALDAGINFIDLYSPAPELRDVVGRAIAGRDDHIVLQGHLCAVWKNGQYERTRNIEDVKAGFEDLMSRIGISRLDIGMIHYVDSLADWEKVANGAVMEYARSLKSQGRIGAIGLSSHNPEAALAAVRSGIIDVLMFSINPCYDLQPPGEDVEKLWAPESYKDELVNMNPLREELYEECSKRGIGIDVMKAFGGGDLLSAEASPAGAALTAIQCLSYALSRPGVASVMAGVRNQADLDSLLSYDTASDEERDYASALASFPRISWEGHCMYCGHCAPCPEKIDVAMTLKLCSLARGREEIPETVREHYKILDAHASDCIRCGACEKRCPFGVRIRDELAKASAIFGY